MLFFPTVLNFFTLFFFRNAKIHLRKLLTTSPVILVKNQRIYYIFNFFQHVRNMHFRRALLQKRIFSDFLNRQFLLDFSSLIEWHMSDPMFFPRVQVTFRRRRAHPWYVLLGILGAQGIVFHKNFFIPLRIQIML